MKNNRGSSNIEKIVVTGGAGLIGSWVVDYLLKEFKDRVGRIVVFDNFSRGTWANLEEALKSKKVKVIEGDIRDAGQVDKLIKGADYVIHEAAIRITQCAEDPRLCNEVLVGGTFNVFEACVKHKVKKLIFNSSASVYGEPVHLPMDEAHPYNNFTAYGAAKIANEQMAKAFRKMYGLNFVSLRPFNVYGPRMDIYGVYTEVMIRWLDRIKEGLPPIIFGDGKQSMDFIYVEDVADATIRGLNSPVNEGFYNVGTGVETNLKQLLKLLLKVTNSKLKPIFQEARVATHVTRRQSDPKKAKKDLHFVAKTDLEKGLVKLVDWHSLTRSKQAYENTHN